MAAKETLTVLYDGECPFCKRYVHMVRLRQNFDVKLINARDNSALKTKATAAGYNLDTGMLVEYKGQYYFGGQAVFLLSSLTTPSNLFNTFMMKLFSSEKLTAIIYPILALGRRMTLFLLQTDYIDNLPKTPKKKWLGYFVVMPFREVISNPGIVANICVRLTAFCLLFTLVFSWPLWFQTQRLFLPEPIFDIAKLIPGWVQQGVAALAIALSAFLFVFPQQRKWGLLLTAALALLVLQDELRWQAFVYMYAFILFAASFIPKKPVAKDFAALRLMIVGIYFWAGFYKINTAFVLEVFPWFMAPLHLDKVFLFYLSCVVPFIECAIGICLFIPRLRGVGVFLATCMLVIVLACLGPLGRNWAMMVWPWNVLLHALEAVLFLYYREPLLQKRILKDKLSWAAIILFWFAPILGSYGHLGSDPSFMLYSGIPMTAHVKFDPREDLSFLPVQTQASMNDHTISLTMIVAYEYNLGTPQGLYYGRNLIEGAKGICNKLLYPQNARLLVHRLRHIWSIDYDQTDLPLCPRSAEIKKAKRA